MGKLLNKLFVKSFKYSLPFYILLNSQNCTPIKSLKDDFEIIHKHDVSYDIDTFYVKNTNEGLNVKVKFAKYDYENILSRYKRNPGAKPRSDEVNLISVNDAPAGIRVRIYNNLEGEIRVLDNKNMAVDELYTDDNGDIEIKIISHPYYNISGALSLEPYIHKYSYPYYFISHEYYQDKSQMPGGEIGYIQFRESEIFAPVNPRNEEDVKNYKILRNRISFFGGETAFSINEKEKRRKKEEERLRAEKIGIEREKIVIENKTREKQGYLERIVESEINSHIKTVNFVVVDLDSRALYNSTFQIIGYVPTVRSILDDYFADDELEKAISYTKDYLGKYDSKLEEYNLRSSNTVTLNLYVPAEYFVKCIAPVGYKTIEKKRKIGKDVKSQIPIKLAPRPIDVKINKDQQSEIDW